MLYPVFSTAQEQAQALSLALAEKPFLVLGLCAAWCNTCIEFRKGFEGLADARADSTFVWLDIEDDAEIAGDIDVENFPTIAVFHRDRLLHFGVSLPQPSIVGRLLAALSAESRTIDSHPAVNELPARLKNLVSKLNQRAPSSASSDSPSIAATNCLATKG
jgi:thioredoxin reductase (NADPH)